MIVINYFRKQNRLINNATYADSYESEEEAIDAMACELKRDGRDLVMEHQYLGSHRVDPDDNLKVEAVNLWADAVDHYYSEIADEERLNQYSHRY